MVGSAVVLTCIRQESANKWYRNTVKDLLLPNTVNQKDEKPQYRTLKSKLPNSAWKNAEYRNTVNPNVPLYIWSIREQTMKNCCLFVFYNNINSFWQPFPLKFLGKLNVQESEKQTSPPSHHFYGLYSYQP